ncbi:MAG: UDP-glucose 4-epimerase GalE [Clostridiales bacterium]|nr:UDP-glucose 4-epimerase GalE [Clostridiales bacterium]
MNILVTGGAGYIATHTIIALSEAGHEVIAVDNFVNSQKESIRRVEKIIQKEIKLYQADVRDEKTLNQIFVENKIDAVIHFAALKAVGESVEKPIEYFDNNLGSLITLCQVMKNHNVKKLVYSSSATVYGESNPMPLTENMPIGEVTNPYGRTKVIGEQILQDLAFSDPKWSIVLLRYFNPIGAHKSGEIGEDPKGIPSNLMPYITEVAVGRLEKIQVFGEDYPTADGTAVRDYIHVMDLADGHVKACEYMENHQGIEIFNLGTGIGYSVLDVIHAFIHANAVDVPYFIGPRRAGDAAVAYANAEKAERILGWKAQYPIEKMCEDSWRWQKKNPHGYEQSETKN